MPPLTVEVTAGRVTRVPLQFKGKTLVRAGVYGRPDPVGWGRLYMHLWHQAVAEGVKADPRIAGDSDDDARERMVLSALRALAAHDSSAVPDRMSYDDAAAILTAARVFTKPMIAFDPDRHYATAGDSDRKAHV